MKLCVCEMVPSAIHANMTAYAAIHYAPAADLYSAVALCLEGRLLQQLPFPPSTHTQYGDTEHVKVRFSYQAPDNCVASWRASVWDLN